MEYLTALWTVAPTLKAQLVIFALLGQVAITIWCYSQMSNARVSAAKSGKITPEMYVAVGDAEPEDLRVYTRLVANQFESPVLFFAIIIAGLAVGVTSWLTVILGFLYIFFRYLHAKEMSGEHVVLKRRKLFIQSVRILLLLALDLAVSTVFMLQV